MFASQNPTLNDLKPYDYFIEKKKAYKKRADHDADLLVAANWLKFAYKSQTKNKRPSAEVLIAAANILENNTPENRQLFAALCDQYENHEHKKSRFLGAALVFFGAACLVGAVALGMTGVGALAGLLMIIAATALLAVGIYALAQGKRSDTEEAMFGFKHAATPWFFKRWFEKSSQPVSPPVQPTGTTI